VPSETRSFCPYKGEATYWHLRIANRELSDAAWSYEAPYDEAAAIRGLVSFYHDQHADLEVEIAAR